MYKNVGKKSIFYFLNSNSKISLLALLTNIIIGHKKPYLDTSTLVQFPPVAHYPKEKSIKNITVLFSITYALTET